MIIKNETHDLAPYVADNRGYSVNRLKPLYIQSAENVDVYVITACYVKPLKEWRHNSPPPPPRRDPERKLCIKLICQGV